MYAAREESPARRATGTVASSASTPRTSDLAAFWGASRRNDTDW